MKKLGTFGMVLTIGGLLLVILVATNEFCGPNNIIEVNPKPQAEKEIEKSKKNPYEGMVIHDYTERIPYQPEESMQMWEQWYK